MAHPITVWVKPINDKLWGRCYEISTEYEDGYLYKADNLEEAVAKYEKDRGVRVNKAMRYVEGEHRWIEF